MPVHYSVQSIESPGRVVPVLGYYKAHAYSELWVEPRILTHPLGDQKSHFEILYLILTHPKVT